MPNQSPNLNCNIEVPLRTRFRATMGNFATGVAVVTTAARGELHGMTVNSLTSVSLDPCMLLVCPRRGSTTGQAIRETGRFAVNLLEQSQRHVSSRFIGRLEDRFEGLELTFSPEGLPLLPGCLAHICCRVHDIHCAGDHDIILGEVDAMEEVGGDPLVFFRGGFGAFQPELSC